MAVARRLSFRLLAMALGLGCTLPPARDARADETPSANVVAARRHYDKARAFYEQGAYRDAIAELDAAHTLDPSAKDLVFNLGIVHEKLGDIDEALTWFRLYATMNLTPAESEKAEAFVRRLEGARKQRDQDAAARRAQGASPEGPASTASTPAAAAPADAERPAPRPPVSASSRFDALTLTAGGIAVAGLVAGTTLGIKALVDQPGGDFVTGRNGSYADLTRQVDGAHAEAVAADVAFVVAAAAGAAFAYLFWLRPHATHTVGATTVSAAPMQSGVAIAIAGSL